MGSQTVLSRKGQWRVGLLSLGCPKTLVDSELILGKLDPERYILAPSVADCDIAILNTCAFIKDAQEESVDQILRLIELKREGPIQKLIVLGCLVQRFPQELQKELKEVDAFVGSGDYALIPEILNRVVGGERLSQIGPPGYLYTSAEARVSLTPAYSRYLKISEGCDHTCSFCVIPQFRGRHRSRLLEDVVKEAERLASAGARELILTGQDTTFFGYDLEGRFLLPELLERLNGISGIRWIRLLYAYPSLVTDRLISSISELRKVCHYLDMPLQHISDRILRSMQRGTSEYSIRRLLVKLRKAIPDLAMRTTFIVGYPGETEEEFQGLLRFMEEARFERLGIFTYSPEESSRAVSLPDRVPEGLKQKRLQAGMLLQQRISWENNQNLVGKVLEVLVEGEEGTSGFWTGRSYMDAPEVDGTVFFRAPHAPHNGSPAGKKGKKIHPGTFVNVRITDTREYDLVGELVETQSV